MLSVATVPIMPMIELKAINQNGNIIKFVESKMSIDNAGIGALNIE